MSINERIVELRLKKGWTQRELAKRVGLNVSVMNRIELGDRSIKDHELDIIATKLEVTADYLLGRSDEPDLTASEYRTVIERYRELITTFDDMSDVDRKLNMQRVRDFLKGISESNKRD